MPTLGRQKAGRSPQVPDPVYTARFRAGKEALSSRVCTLFCIVSSGQQNCMVRLSLKTKLNEKVCSYPSWAQINPASQLLLRLRDREKMGGAVVWGGQSEVTQPRIRLELESGVTRKRAEASYGSGHRDSHPLPGHWESCLLPCSRLPCLPSLHHSLSFPDLPTSSSASVALLGATISLPLQRVFPLLTLLPFP